MPRMSRFLAILAICAGTAFGLAACGGEDAELLSGDTAENITRNLDLVEELADAGDCVGAEEATAEVADQVDELQVDSQLQAALSEGVELLSSIVAECQEAEVEEEEPEETLEPLEEPAEEEEEPRRAGKDRERDETQPQEETRAEPTTPSEEEDGESEEPAPSEEEEEDPSGGLGPGEPAGSE